MKSTQSYWVAVCSGNQIIALTAESGLLLFSETPQSFSLGKFLYLLTADVRRYSWYNRLTELRINRGVVSTSLFFVCVRESRPPAKYRGSRSVKLLVVQNVCVYFRRRRSITNNTNFNNSAASFFSRNFAAKYKTGWRSSWYVQLYWYICRTCVFR